ncbi:MAG: general stress protein [Bacillota bacterium]
MAKVVLGVFRTRGQAEDAVNKLRSQGFDKEISILSKDENKEADKEGNLTSGGPLAGGVTTGGAIGGLAGLAVGAGALVIPGIGPLIAAGPIAGMLSGAATGGIAGGLIDWGIPAEEGKKLEEDIRYGKILISVHTDDTKANDAAKVMSSFGAENVKIHDSRK